MGYNSIGRVISFVLKTFAVSFCFLALMIPFVSSVMFILTDYIVFENMTITGYFIYAFGCFEWLIIAICALLRITSGGFKLWKL